MLTFIILVSFVVVCILVLALREFSLRRKAEVEWLEEQIEEDVVAGVFDWDYSGLTRMDVPGKYPALRTRSTKVHV